MRDRRGSRRRPTAAAPAHTMGTFGSGADADGDADAALSPCPVEAPRVLGLDVGSVRIGVALSCPFGRMATPHGVLLRARDPFGAIARLCQEREVALIVVGRPLRLSGEEGPAVLQIEGFVRRLQQEVDLEIAWVDERLTTRAAERTLLAHGASRKQRRAHIDEVAATLLLQTYLDGARLVVAPAGK